MCAAHPTASGQRKACLSGVASLPGRYGTLYCTTDTPLCRRWHAKSLELPGTAARHPPSPPLQSQHFSITASSPRGRRSETTSIDSRGFQKLTEISELEQRSQFTGSKQVCYALSMDFHTFRNEQRKQFFFLQFAPVLHETFIVT